METLVGQVIDGRYRIEAVVARGGMATVFEAVDLRLDRTVALKVMNRSYSEDPGFVARFQREARSAARLSHPNVVAVYDQGEDGDLVYLVMEYVEGRNVRDLLRERGPMAPEQALAILDPVLEALSVAHSAGIVHRDIKPENVLIGIDGEVVVADFGLARAVTSSTVSTTQGVLIGTVAYLSPEQVERGIADPRSDVYSAGILLFEMVTGQVPHDGDSPLAVAYQHVHADVPAPSTIRPGIPAEVDALVAMATRRDPDARYADARGFLADVRRVRAGLPAAASLSILRPTQVVSRDELPPPPAPTTSRTAPQPRRAAPRRRRGAVALVLLLLAVVGAGVAGWYLSAGPGRTVTVPGMVGQTVPEAEAAARAAGLQVEVVGQEFSETVPADRVISTDPSPGSDARTGSSIGLVVSKGPERYAVPRVAGLTPEDAAAALTSANLRVGAVKERFDATIPVGTVVGSDPAEGVPLKPDSSVDILVSKGPRPIPVPKVAGMSRADAEAAVTSAGLVPSVSEEYSDTVALGTVIRSDPRSGIKLQEGDTVTLVVSKGPPPVEVPDLVDMQREDAIAALEARGLVPDVREGIVTPLNRVFSQSPGPGQMVPRGSTVTITIV